MGVSQTWFTLFLFDLHLQASINLQRSDSVFGESLLFIFPDVLFFEFKMYFYRLNHQNRNCMEKAGSFCIR